MRANGAIPQLTHHRSSRKRQHPHFSISALLVARDECLGGTIHSAHCQQSKICTTKKKTPLYCIPGDLSMCPFNVITLDLITQLPKANGHDAILTVVDQGCSRTTIFLPCHTTITGEGVALLYLKHLFLWFGVPSKVISDWDPCFTSHFAQALTTKLSIG